MISNHLSMVEALRPASNELAHNIAAFLSQGGTIEVLETQPEKPRVRHEPPPSAKPVKPVVRRRTAPKTFQIDSSDVRREKRAEKVETVKAMAATHTQTEVSAVTGMTPRTLRDMAREFGFSFKRAAHGGHYGDEWKAEMKIRDANCVERIRAFKELGISRRRVCCMLSISHSTLDRILTEHGIEYPKARRGKFPKTA